MVNAVDTLVRSGGLWCGGSPCEWLGGSCVVGANVPSFLFFLSLSPYRDPPLSENIYWPIAFIVSCTVAL